MQELWDIIKQYAALFFIVTIGSQLNIIRGGADDNKWYVKSISRLLLSLLLVLLAHQYIKDYLPTHYWVVIFAVAANAVEIYDWIKGDLIEKIKKIIEKKISSDNS